MMPQAQDFLAESDALFHLIDSVDPKHWREATGFKAWTIEHIIGHLYTWNHAADLSLKDGDAFGDFFKPITAHLLKGGTLRQYEQTWLGDLHGRDLLERWRKGYQQLAADFSVADPSARVVWAGPSMSVRSSVTARLMETWAHGQAVYDLLGVDRKTSDSALKNIVMLGVNTFGWSFKAHRLEPPALMPYLRLVAPSGEVWEYGEPSFDSCIEGRADEFCQVVTQTRNIADTGLSVTGDAASAWMEKAQCFAGPPETPPAPGARRKAETPVRF